ncbi:MAG: purine-nucleoside phosphorylase [Hyphomicrobiales bacterium]|nr:purine-nucleoside phosphorylase [Hyphomicrobiales bacterium]MBV9114135.1 purine-nucleoside phosphorylase [Hyphomicrobiales bacterium]MBV9518298.1 purine-nucleoside phosphorylase [Hyphomicrobiales bacterium]
MYSGQDPERVMELLRDRGLEASIEIGIVTGTGLATILKEVENALEVPYDDLPGFPQGFVSGHARRLVIGNVGRLRVALLQGRSHYYETGDAQAMRTPIEVLLRLGAHSVVLTSSVGSVKPNMRPGALTIVADHINLSGVNPLHNEQGDARFVPMTDAYDETLRHRLKRAAASQGVALHDSIYMFMPGPSFETPAEIRAATLLGADVVGMSIVPETIIARRYGLKVAALCAVTNLGAGLEGAAPSHNETKRMAATAAISLRRIFDTFIRTLDEP